MPPPRNVWVDGQWFGPDYPDAGDPPSGAVDPAMLGDEPTDLEDGDFVGHKAVTEPDEVVQFSGGQAVVDEDEPDSEARQGPEDRGVELLDEPSQAVTTDEQATAFIGEPPPGSGEPAPAEQSEPGPPPPPKSGQGAARAKWLDYALSQGVQVDAAASREDIIAACESAGVRTS